MDRGHFDWRTLGKADYSQASALVSSLPEPIRAKVRHGMREILVRIVHLGWGQALKSGRGAAYCWPTEGWFAKQIGQSVRTVRRCLVLLKQAKLIVWRPRFNRFGAWTSNLYELGSQFLASLFARAGKKVQRIQARTKMADNDLKREYKLPPENGEASLLSSLREKLRAYQAVRDSVPPLAGAYAVYEGAQSVAERKALLKAQAAMLIARGD